MSDSTMYDEQQIRTIPDQSSSRARSQDLSVAPTSGSEVALVLVPGAAEELPAVGSLVVVSLGGTVSCSLCTLLLLMFVYAGGSSMVSAGSSSPGPASSCCTMLTGLKTGGRGLLRMYVDVPMLWPSGVVDLPADVPE